MYKQISGLNRTKGITKAVLWSIFSLTILKTFFFCFVVAMCDLVYDVETIVLHGLILTANIIRIYFSHDAQEAVNCSGHHSDFRKYFQMLIAFNKGEKI